MKDKILSARVFGTVALNGAPAIEFKGRKYFPDETKAYATFSLARGFPVVTAYGTCVHPGTIANSFHSLLHQQVDYDHQLKVNSTKKREIANDRIIGGVVDVEFPNAPIGGWKVGRDKEQSPAINGLMSIYKNADKVKTILGEHLAGRHKWTVSMEMGFSMLGSGFVIGDRDKATKKQTALMAEQTPTELSDLGLGYVALMSAPDDLLKCLNMDQGRIVDNWGACPVTLMQGGINGETHFKGVGIVRYGAEREAEISQILASDPDKLMDMDVDGDGVLQPFVDAQRAALDGFETAARVFGTIFKVRSDIGG